METWLPPTTAIGVVATLLWDLFGQKTVNQIFAKEPPVEVTTLVVLVGVLMLLLLVQAWRRWRQRPAVDPPGGDDSADADTPAGLLAWTRGPARRLLAAAGVGRLDHLDPPAAAAMLGTTTDRAADLLTELDGVGLTVPVGELRHRIAPDVAAAAATASDWRTRWYRRTAVRRALPRLLRHYAIRAELEAAALAAEDSGTAHAWFAAEQDQLSRLARDERAARWDRAARRRLAAALITWYHRTGARGLEPWAELAAEFLVQDDPQDKVFGASSLGAALRMRGRVEEADWELGQAELDGETRTGTLAAELRARARNTRALVAIDRGDLTAARELLAVGHPHPSEGGGTHAAAHANLGVLRYLEPLAEAGRRDRPPLRALAEATDHLLRARDLYRNIGDAYGEAEVLDTLGQVDWWCGREELAVRRWERSLELSRKLDDRAAEARVLLHLGTAALAPGGAGPQRTRELLNASLELRSGLPETYGVGLCHLRLGDAAWLMGEEATAREEWAEAARVLRQYEHPVARAARAELDRRPWTAPN